jgi:hypothetical protein
VENPVTYFFDIHPHDKQQFDIRRRAYVLAAFHQLAEDDQLLDVLRSFAQRYRPGVHGVFVDGVLQDHGGGAEKVGGPGGDFTGDLNGRVFLQRGIGAGIDSLVIR